MGKSTLELSLKNSPNEKQARQIEKASKFTDEGVSKHTSALKELMPFLPWSSWEIKTHLLPSESKKRIETS